MFARSIAVSTDDAPYAAGTYCPDRHTVCSIPDSASAVRTDRSDEDEGTYRTEYPLHSSPEGTVLNRRRTDIMASAAAGGRILLSIII